MNRNPHCLKHPFQPAWNMHSGHLKALLGIKGKLPKEGTKPQIIQGWSIRVEPLKGEAPKWGKRHTHRVIATCPNCGQEMSAGRTHQHKCINLNRA